MRSFVSSFFKELLLVQIGMHRNDFNFFFIREVIEVSVFVIDSVVMKYTGELIRILE
jgi:hypothetical protein